MKRLSFAEKDNLTTEELIEYFQELKEYYLSLPYDSEEIAKQEKQYQFVSSIARPIFRIIFNPLIVNPELLPKTEGNIFVSNHLTYVDQFLLGYTLGNRAAHFMASSQFKTMKRGGFYRFMGAVFVDRDDDNSKEQARILQTQMVLNGSDVFIFPEGTRKPPYDVLKPFKLGAVTIAQETGAPIIPMVINNTYKRNQLVARICSEPIYVQPTDDLKGVNQQLWETIDEGIQENEKIYKYIRK